MNYRLPNHLEILAFIIGFVLMAYELAAARILAPTIGSSTYVWTSVIGVIIAAMSIGYYVGGRLADKRARQSDVGWQLFAGAVAILLTVILYPSILEWLLTTDLDVRVQAVIASLILFAPTSLIIGSISPYLAKLNVTSLKQAGTAVASLSAWNAIGGISGTFVTGFILFGLIGSRAIFLCLIGILLVASLSIVGWRVRRVTVAVMVLVSAMAAPLSDAMLHIDTASAHYMVFDWQDKGKQLRGLAMGPDGVQSGIEVGQPTTPIFWYTQEFAALARATPKKKDILMLGGGTFTVPQHLAAAYPDSQIDVVEIDPALQAISRQYFGYKDHSNLTVISDDARTYSNKTRKQYDIVMVDVYSNIDVPFSFTTTEYGKAIHRMMRPGGVVMVNMVAGLKGGCRDLLATLEAPYRQAFAHRALKVTPDASTDRRNIVALYSDVPLVYAGYEDREVPKVTAFTDDFAPIEWMRERCTN